MRTKSLKWREIRLESIEISPARAAFGSPNPGIPLQVTEYLSVVALKTFLVLHPIYVVPAATRYELVAGFCSFRLARAVVSRDETVPVMVIAQGQDISRIGEVDRLLSSLFIHNTRQELATIWREAMAAPGGCDVVQGSEQMTRKKIASLLGVSRNRVPSGSIDGSGGGK